MDFAPFVSWYLYIVGALLALCLWHDDDMPPPIRWFVIVLWPLTTMLLLVVAINKYGKSR